MTVRRFRGVRRFYVLCVLCVLCILCVLYVVRDARAQSSITTRVAVIEAEDRRAPTPRDLATIRGGVHSGDPQTIRIAVRALGRLERTTLIPDILPSLKHPLPEIRAEAANALGQALHGSTKDAAATVDPVIAALIARVGVEAEATVRGAIYQTLGRVPVNAEQAARVDAALADAAAHESSIDAGLGIADGFESLIRKHRQERAPSDAAIDALRSMAVVASAGARAPVDPSRSVRIRRLALEALVSSDAVDARTLERAAADPDSQVRRIAMRAATADRGADAVTRGMTDPSPMVRLEAVRAQRTPGGRSTDAMCRAAVIATGDSDTNVVLFALDQLAGCGSSTDAAAVLERTVNDLPDAGKPRAWHRAAHAIVALAAAVPARAKDALTQFLDSPIWQMRMYAARAAAALGDRAALERLAVDDDDNVREAAVVGLSKVAGHAADAVYVSELTRSGYQILRAAALALAGTPSHDAAVPALKSALQRLVAEGRDNSHDARYAIEQTLATVGGQTRGQTRGQTHESPVSAEDLRRFAAARARVTMRGLGTFELVLFTAEAPVTVLRFARLAQQGYYNGLTFHRVVPNFVIQGGSPGANEYIGDAAFMRDEVGLWPHVRGAVGISTRGHDTGDAQIFIDLVDNPRLDHEYTVFAQVLNGLDVVDQILEGDVIEKIDIVF